MHTHDFALERRRARHPDARRRDRRRGEHPLVSRARRAPRLDSPPPPAYCASIPLTRVGRDRRITRHPTEKERSHGHIVRSRSLAIRPQGPRAARREGHRPRSRSRGPVQRQRRVQADQPAREDSGVEGREGRARRLVGDLRVSRAQPPDAGALPERSVRVRARARGSRSTATAAGADLRRRRSSSSASSGRASSTSRPTRRS